MFGPDTKGSSLKHDPPINILIVDDHPENLIVLERILTQPGVNFLKANSGNEALAKTLEHDIALVLLDVQMPEMDGFETADLLRINQRTKHTPIIFITAISKDEAHVHRGYESGAVDYIFKPFNPEILRSKVQIFCDLYLAKRAAERSNMLLETTLDSLNEGVIATDDEQKIIFFSKNAELMTGWKAADAVGRLLHTVFRVETKQGLENIVEHLGQAAKDDTYQNRTASLTKKNGETIYIVYHGRLIQNPSGDTFGTVVTFADVSERIRIEQRLKQVLLEQSIILDNIIAGIIYLQNGEIRWANNQAARLLEIDRDEIEGQSFSAILEAVPGSENLLQEITDKSSLPEGFHGEFQRIDSEHNPRWFRLISRSVSAMEERKADIIVLFEEITQQKKSAAEREKMRAQLLQAQKMEAIGTLAAGVAHDFNNVLTAIQGYLELGILKVNKRDPAYTDLEKAHGASKRAADLVRQLLLFSRKQPMQFSSINLQAVIQGLLKMLKRFIGEDIEIQTSIADGLWQVKGDAGNIEQVLMNLAVNARDAMPNGGRLTIAASNIELLPGTPFLNPDARPGQFVKLEVSDSGSGIDPNILEHIFEPFFTTKGEGQGTGLGLSVVYGIVKEHKGWIDVSSGEADAGTTFSVFLPYSENMPETAPEQTENLNNMTGQGSKILVVEDEHQVRVLAEKALQENGYRVYCAANCKEAQHLFAREKGEFALIFSDIVLPDGQGLALTDTLREQNPKIKVLLSSGYTGSKSRWLEIKDRNIPFLQKPYRITELVKMIFETLH